MQTLVAVPARDFNGTHEIRVGKSTWDPEDISVKFTWETSNGSVARGGEVPVEAIPQMLELAVKEGYLKLSAAAE